MHEGLGEDLVRIALLGPYPPEHTEIAAFIEAFGTPTENGYNYCSVSCCFPAQMSPH